MYNSTCRLCQGRLILRGVATTGCGGMRTPPPNFWKFSPFLSKNLYFYLEKRLSDGKIRFCTPQFLKILWIPPSHPKSFLFHLIVSREIFSLDLNFPLLHLYYLYMIILLICSIYESSMIEPFFWYSESNSKR